MRGWAVSSAIVCCIAIAVAARVSSGAPSAKTAKPTTAADEFHATIQPLLQRYCYECHGGDSSSGDLKLDKFKSVADMAGDVKIWEKVIRNARTHLMPPPDAEKFPTQDDRDNLVEAVQRQIYHFDPFNPDPGRVTIRRLNRNEYRNTVRDLIGVSFDPTIDFPQDDTGYGFDNIGDVLTLPPMLMEKYLVAASKILDEAINTDPIESIDRKIPAARARFTPDGRAKVDGDWMKLSSVNEDALTVQIQAPVRADYNVRVLAYSTSAVQLSLMLGDAIAQTVDVKADREHPQWYEARVGVPAGKQSIRVSMRRQRGSPSDLNLKNGRPGAIQAGDAYVKEIQINGPAKGSLRQFDVERISLERGAERYGDTTALLRTDDQVSVSYDASSAGEHLLRVQAYADMSGDEPAKMELAVDDKPVTTFVVTAPSKLKQSSKVQGLAAGADRAVPRVYEKRTNLAKGKHEISVRYLNNARNPEDPEPNLRDRNIFVQRFEVVNLSASPLPPPMTGPMRELFVRYAGPAAANSGAPMANNEAGARKILDDFALHAWRRPPQPQEIDRLMKLYNLARTQGESFHGSIKHAMNGVLVSSNFLFRGEIPPPATEERIAQTIGEFELASRLSYFLWSTTPDNELLDLAKRGELRKNLDAQVKRMLASPKSSAFVENFAGQWLQFRNLDASHPDTEMFERYNDRLRDAMRRETQLFFENLMREDRSLIDILTADYTYVNERLAAFYGINGVKGDDFRRVSLAGTPRRGVMTQGSILTLTSNPTRTSPVKRGKWVLENLLGTPPPPPPPEVPPLETEGRKLTGTVRHRLEQHRADPQCATCHAPMDSIGFAMENFDAIGAWRDNEAGAPVDASGAFAGGATFKGPVELVDLLAKTRRKDFFRSVTESALTFALGRGVETLDLPAVDRIVGDLQKNDAKFSTLIFGIVNSVPFQMHRVQSPEGATQSRADGINIRAR